MSEPTQLVGCAHAVHRLLEAFCRSVEQRAKVRLWDHGLGEIAEEWIRRSEIPNRTITAVEAADAAGLLPRRRKHG